MTKKSAHAYINEAGTCNFPSRFRPRIRAQPQCFRSTCSALMSAQSRRLDVFLCAVCSLLRNECARVHGACPATIRSHAIPHISMKLLSYLVRPFYSVEKKSSREQLQDDFGDFPPTPLRCESLTGNFNVVRTRGIGAVYCDLVVHKRLLQAIDSDPQSLSPDLTAFFNTNSLLAFRQVFDVFNRVSRFGKPVAMSLVLGVMLVFKTARALRYGRTKPNGMGLFVPMLKNESQIFIKAGRHQHRSDAPTISHEHIHMLQHKDPEIHSRNVRSPQVILSEKSLVKPFLHYLLEKREVEARLHESVLSFYRAHQQLPVTASAFLGLLASSLQFGWLVTGTLKLQGVTYDRGLGQYPERAPMFTEQLEFVLLYIKTQELQCRFITEVLPVMYGNLLKYYGDEAASLSYFEDIERPNFYDDLYGAETA